MRKSSALVGVVILAALVLVAAGCGDDGESTDNPSGSAVSISDSWSRQPAVGQTATAVYGVVSNSSDADRTIVSVSSQASDTVQLHETVMNDKGEMSMREVAQGFVIPAGGTITFEPGGPHIMLLDIDAATYPSDVEVTLGLDDSTSLTFSAEVRSVDGEPMGMSDHDSGATGQ